MGKIRRRHGTAKILSFVVGAGLGGYNSHMSGQWTKLESKAFRRILGITLVFFVVFVWLLLFVGRTRYEEWEVVYDQIQGQQERVTFRSYESFKSVKYRVLAEAPRTIQIYYQRSPIFLSVEIEENGIDAIRFSYFYGEFSYENISDSPFETWHWDPKAGMTQNSAQYSENPEIGSEAFYKVTDDERKNDRIFRRMKEIGLPNWRSSRRTVLFMPGGSRTVHHSEDEMKSILEPYIAEIRALADTLEAAMFEEEIAAE